MRWHASREPAGHRNGWYYIEARDEQGEPVGLPLALVHGMTQRDLIEALLNHTYEAGFAAGRAAERKDRSC